MEVINSLENKKIKKYSKLLDKKYRDIEGLFIVEGEHLVEEAYQSNDLIEVIKTEDYEKDYNVLTTYVTYDVLKKLSKVLTPQKIIGICQKKTEKAYGNKILILDDIQDPGNLGTIIRSSVAFGIDTICLSNKTVDLYNDKVIRSSEGMLFHINIIKRDILKLLEELKNKNYVIYGTKVDNGQDINSINPPLKYALVVGNEGSGISQEVLEKCDEYLYIKMNKECESLNVGVATSIILYTFNRD